MSRDKQIEEMAQKLVDFFNERKGKVCLKDFAELLYNAGYRKASDIFEEIERAFFKHYDEQVTYSSPTLPYHIREALGFSLSLNVLFMEIEKLKKKYESEGEG